MAELKAADARDAERRRLIDADIVGRSEKLARKERLKQELDMSAAEKKKLQNDVILREVTGQLMGKFSSVKDAFRAIDLDYSGVITLKEIGDMFERRHMDLPPAKKKHVLNLPVSYTHLTLPTICSV